MTSKTKRVHRLLREVGSLGALIFIMLAARSSLADHYHVPTGSMEPTVLPGDRLLVNKLAYGLRVPFSSNYVVGFDEPQRGDVVVLESPTDGTVLLKRIVALPTDTVSVQRGQLVLNGRPVPIVQDEGTQLEQLGPEPHLVRTTRGGGPDVGPMSLPEDKYLVLGDNRGDSYDGRLFGLVSRGAIRGRAIAVYYRNKPIWRPL